MDQQRDTDKKRSPEKASNNSLTGRREEPTGDTAALPLGQPLVPPLELSSVWCFTSPTEAEAALDGSLSETFVYRRENHPSAQRLERVLAQMHGASDAIVTAQGMSAIAAVALACLAPGDTVWVAEEVYGKTMVLFFDHLAKWGIRSVLFDPYDDQSMQRIVVERPRMVFVETVSNPRLRVVDLQRLRERVHSVGGLLVVDNTFATAHLCRPLDWGADVVVESLSKQVCGHSDAMLGLVATVDPSICQSVRRHVASLGMTSSPIDCYLTERGLQTLEVRVERACRNAAAVADLLSAQAIVRGVDYPGLPSHPQHRWASRLLSGGFGWMVTMHFAMEAGTMDDAFRVLTRYFPFAPSLGDVRTTLSHPASTSHRSLSDAEQAKLGICRQTVRISCGIEATDTLRHQFQQALAAVAATVGRAS
ncbi:MAG: cystathionine gamma-synthase [Pirellulaceae bacterium]|nr:MAG: cystathionine gamma-synthase [Pirellulaceae bacterium]